MTSRAAASADSAEGAVLARHRRDRRWPPAVPLAIVAALVVCAVSAPLLTPHSPLEGSLGERLAPPIGMDGAKPGHPLGSDRHGRDTLSRLLYGARISLAVSVVGISLTGNHVHHRPSAPGPRGRHPAPAPSATRDDRS